MPSLHIGAEKGQIAKHVLMPGDPLRAKIMSERMLKNPQPINQIRNMLGFTGTYQGKEITIMGSGMGVPSIGIYSHELFSFYDVENIIRVGTCGSIQPYLDLRDIVIAQAISTDSNYLKQFGMDGTYSPTASWSLLDNAANYCQQNKLTHHVGNVLCSDIFYHHDENSWKKWAAMNVLCIEMESVALYANAAKWGKKALTILTVSDQIVLGKKASAEERETAFSSMFEIALASIA